MTHPRALHFTFCLLFIISTANFLECTTNVEDQAVVNDTPKDVKDPHSLQNDSFNNSTHSNHSSKHSSHGVHLASWNFRRVSAPLLMTVILIMAGFLKLIFHYAECLSSIIPESCLLIIFGIVVGAILHADARPDNVTLEPDVFMLYLLPPIVLDSAYSLNDRVVFQNLGAILLYAVVGTIINFLLIGPALWGLSLAGAMGTMKINLIQCLLFSSFIVAVDPVAVLAIFQEIGVNNKLYFLVFGESLLNDAVTVVLYNMMLAFNNVEVITWQQILTGIGSFFTVSLGACLIGLVFGIMSALVTRLTSIVRVVEPLAVLMIAYMSYLFAELFHWSGIISLIVCGLMQAEYSQHNISRKSYITIKYFVKMISTTADTVIFVFLGLEVVRTSHEWHTGFVLWALALCLIGRLLTVLGLTACVNSKHKIISFKEQFIMWYGGLRGAVCFALCATISDDFPHKNIFLTTTMVVIFFTVFVQGITIKPLVSCCNITLAEEKEMGVALEFNSFVVDHLMAATEALAGQEGDNYWRASIERLNNKYFRKWLQSNPMTQDQRLLATYERVALKDHQRHIYEATHKEVHIKTVEEAEEPMTPDLIMVEEKHAEKKHVPSVISGLFGHESQGQEGPADGMGKLRWALARTALLSTTAHYDRNLTHDDEEDFAAKLHEKHQRMEHNHYLRHIHPISEHDIEASAMDAAKGVSGAVDNTNNNHKRNRSNSTKSMFANMASPAAENSYGAHPRRRLSDIFGRSKAKTDMFTVAKMLKQKNENGKNGDTVNIVLENTDSSEVSGRTSPAPTTSERSFHTARTDLDVPITNIDSLNVRPEPQMRADVSPSPRRSDPRRSPRTSTTEGFVNKAYVKTDKDSEEVTEL